MKKIAFALVALIMASCGSSSSSSQYVALSFDDGPNNVTTPKVLDVLEAYDAPASFFVIGQNIDDSTAEQMKRAVKLGCEIQNHSFTHTFMSQLTAEQVQAEIERTDSLIEKYIGVRPWLFRPPYIDHNEIMHKAVDHTFICGVGCNDWVPEVTAQQRYDQVIANVKNGDVILLHDFPGNDNTVQALGNIIQELRNRGFTLVTVTELFEKMGVSPEARNGILYTNVMQTE